MSIGSVIGSSLIWILIFYVIKTFCDTLGEAGIISAWIVTLIPLCVILLASISMLWKNR
jgi:lipopolysaccharide export LptBFGC system permease protein LptF